MFDKFTDRSRRIIAAASKEALRRRCDFIGCEHILLALVGESSGIGATALRSLWPPTKASPAEDDKGVFYNAVMIEVDKICGPKKGDSYPEPLPFTPDAREALEFARQEAVALKHPYVGTEHILLGLIRGTSYVAVAVLESLGFNRQEISDVVMGYLKDPEAEKPMRRVEREYKLVGGVIASSSLEELVAQFIADEWEPIGGPASFPVGLMYQAMIRWKTVDIAPEGK